MKWLSAGQTVVLTDGTVQTTDEQLMTSLTRNIKISASSNENDDYWQMNLIKHLLDDVDLIMVRSNFE